MNITNLKSLMQFYYELSRSSILFLEIGKSIKDIDCYGLSYKRLLEIYELSELLTYLKNTSNQFLFERNSTRSFMTFQTANHYLYNIHLLKHCNDSVQVLISGPMLSGFPTIKQINTFSKDIHLELKERQKVLQELYHLPKFSQKKIFALGKLLFSLLHKDIDSLDEIEQIFPKHTVFDSELATFPTDKSYSFDVDTLFHFLMKMEKDFLNDHPLDIGDTIQDNLQDLNELIHKYDNLYSLKSFSLILCTTSYFHALNSNISFEILFHKLWNFVEKLGPLHTSEDVILLMTHTLREFKQLMFFEQTHYSPHVNQILKYIRIHYKEKITLEQLAAQLHISTVYISHIIKKDTNLTLSDHINLVRIKHGKALLNHTEQSISEIAYSLGYNYQSHFTKAFKKYTNQTPSEYRALRSQSFFF